MPDISYDLFDTAPFSTTAGVEHALFQTGAGADSTHTKQYTNSPGAGVLPQTEKFLIESIHIFPQDPIPAADADVLFQDSWLEVEVNNRSMLRSPLRMFASHASFGGHYTQAAAANDALIGLQGMGRMLKIPILVPGSTRYEVVVYQGTALSAAADILCVLSGTLTIP